MGSRDRGDGVVGTRSGDRADRKQGGERREVVTEWGMYISNLYCI